MFELSTIFPKKQSTAANKLKKSLSFLSKKMFWMVLLLVAGISSTTAGMWIYSTSSQSPQESDQVVIHTQPEPSSVIVDVSGAVNSPGIYSLSQGERVGSAVSAAGGLIAVADLEFVHKSINLAKPITDGEKIYIPFSELDTQKTTELPKSETGAGNLLVSINTATKAELEALPNIGEVTAEKIIQNRPFTSITELVVKNVLSEGVLQKIKDAISI